MWRVTVRLAERERLSWLKTAVRLRHGEERHGASVVKAVLQLAAGAGLRYGRERRI